MEIEQRGNTFQKIITNLFIFRKPNFEKKDYENVISNFSDKLIFIQKRKESISADNYIPCLYFKNPKSSNFLIYFHGNSEDIFQIEHYGLNFRSYLEMNVIMVEYPGYSLYMDDNPEPNKFFSDSLIVYDWIKETFKISDKQIFVCGRSLGTSPSIYLSSHRDPQALFLISAFTSMKNIGYDKNLSIFIEPIFRSINHIKCVKAPILFIHGEKDPLISDSHSKMLKDEVLQKGLAKIVELDKRPNMTHNEFNMKKDIMMPIIKFLNTHNISFSENNKINIEENKINQLFKFPLEISIKISSLIFDINEFNIDEKIYKKNASLLKSLVGNKMALINGSIISIYNTRYFFLDYEINLTQIINKEVTIKSLYQLKNENLVCASEKGDIFIFKIEKKRYEKIKIFSLNADIFKIEEYFENLICVLSIKFIKIYNEDFSKELLSLDNNETFTDFCTISKDSFVLIKEENIYFKKISSNEMNAIKAIKINEKGLLNTPTKASNYLIISDNEKIYFVDTKDFKFETIEINETISFILKILDNLLLASTYNGEILQIIIKDNGKKEILKKHIINTKISSILFVDYNTILFTEKDQIVIMSKSKKESCEIF